MTPIALKQPDGVRYPLISIGDANDISGIALALEAHGVTCDVIGDFLSDWARDQAAANWWVSVTPLEPPQTE